ncbi:unnamed protein product, partial [Didymodactylos carnosus]
KCSLFILLTFVTMIFVYSFKSSFYNIFYDRISSSAVNISLNYSKHEKLFIDETDLLDFKHSLPTLSPSATHIHLLKENYFNTTNLYCQYPKLSIDSKDIWNYLRPVKKKQPECEKVQNWVYTDNGTFRLSQEAVQKYGPINCSYRAILRGKNDFSTIEEPPLLAVVDKMPLVSDFFRVHCRGRDGLVYSNIHSSIKFDADLHMRHKLNPMVKRHLGYNVLMFGFDSVSRMTFMRLLPKTYSFLVFQLGAVVMKGRYSAFQMRLLGFRDQPVDHYVRPFLMVAESRRTRDGFCFGSITRFKNMLNWIKEFFEMYPPYQPKFSFLLHKQYSHDTNNLLPYADDEALEFLQYMNKHGYLDNTMLMIMTDHGARYSQFRTSYQGKLEERLPFMSIRMPPKFQQQYPHLMRNLRLNSHRLTTPFDIHETFLNLLDFHSHQGEYQSKTKRSYSLLQLIPETRRCEESAVENHWCTCLEWSHISLTSSVIEQFGQAAVHFLNYFVRDVKEKCAQLTLYQILKAHQASIRNKKKQFYQIQFETRPGNGQFELTATYNQSTQTFDIKKTSLSRINKYGSTSACIAHKRPEFREICYCSMNAKMSRHS